MILATDRSHHLFWQVILMLSLIILLLAACAENASAPAQPTTAETVVPPTEAPTSLNCADGFRPFDHELLATEPLCIPENPERIAFVDSTIDYAVALGVESVTRSYYLDAFLGDFPNLADEAAISKMTDVGNTWEINAEAVVVARPDLIVTSTWWPEANEQIQAIAPTVIFDHDRAETWRQSLDAVAQLTGRTEARPNCWPKLRRV